MAKRKRRATRFPLLGRLRKSESRAARRRAGRAPTAALTLESLEPRVLLTTLHGGESFEYHQADPSNPLGLGAQIRVSINGDATVELITADFLTDGTGQIEFGDTPGRILPFDNLAPAGGPLSRSDTDVRGGIGGADGLELIGPIAPIFDPSGAVPPPPNAGAINVTAIASQDAVKGGNTYGFNQFTVNVNNTPVPHVTLLELDNSSGQGQVASSLHAARISAADDIASFVDIDGNPEAIFGISAMAFDETTGLGYLIADVAGADHLFRFSRFSGLIEDLGAITNTTTGNTLNDIEAMAIAPNGTLYFITSDYDGDPTADASGLPANAAAGGMGMGGMLTTSTQDVGLVNLGDPDQYMAGAPVVGFTNAQAQSIVVNMTIMGFNQNFEVVTPYTALTFNPNNPNQLFAANTFSTGMNMPPTSELHRIGLGGGGAVVALNRGAIDLNGEMVRVEGFAAAVDRQDNPIIVGVDLSVLGQNNVILPRLISMPLDNPSAAAINSAGDGTTANVSALASLEEPGITPGRPLLYSAINNNIIRGTAISLPVAPDTGLSTVTAINGADFHPDIGSTNDGRLFFTVARPGVNDRLFSLDLENVPPDIDDPTAPDRVALQNSIVELTGVNNGGLGGTGITSIAFDQFGAATTLVTYNGTNGQLRAAVLANGSLVNLNPAPVVTLTGQGVVTGGSGIAFIDDPDVPEQFLYLTDDANDRIIRVNWNGTAGDPINGSPTAGNGTQFQSQWLGNLPDPDHVNNLNPFAANRVPNPRRGQNIVSLDYNETIRNPFTGETGALIATDSGTDELVILDSRTRAPAADVFIIYVTQSSPDASIAIAEVPTGPDIGFESVVNAIAPNGRFAQTGMDPFGGSVNNTATMNAFGVTHAQTGNAIFITADAQTGEVIVGTRTFDGGNPNVNLNPIFSGSLTENIGTRPMGVDDTPDNPDNPFDPNNFTNISAGVFVKETLLDYLEDLDFTPLGSQTLGDNLDIIGDLSISRTETAPGTGPLAAVVDTDGVDSQGINFVDIDGDLVQDPGEPDLGDELSIFIPEVDFFGFNTTTAPITDAVTGAPLSGVQGLDFGDIDFDGTEELFAIFATDTKLPTIDVGGIAIATGATLDLTVTENGTIYTVERSGGNTARLRRINRDPVTGNILSTTDLGLITDGSGNPIVDVFSIDAYATGQGDALAIAGRRDRDGDSVPEVEQELFLVEPITRDLDFDTTADEVLARPIGIIGAFFAPLTQPVHSLVFRGDGQAIHVFADTDGAFGGDLLLNIDPATAQVFFFNPGGPVTDADGDPVQVRSADTGPGGSILGFDAATNTLANIDVIAPGNSVNDLLAVPASQIGFTSNGRDLFSVDSAGATILQNLTDAPVLGTLDIGQNISSDQDVFRVIAAPGDILTASVSGFTLADPSIRLLDDQGNELDAELDFDQDQFVSITFTQFPASGDYFIVVDSFTGANGSYTLNLDLTTVNLQTSGNGPIFGEAEPNDDGDGVLTAQDLAFADDFSDSWFQAAPGVFQAGLFAALGGGSNTLGQFTEIAPIGASGERFKSMAFLGTAGSAGVQGLIVLDENNQLFEVNPTNAAQIGGRVPVIDANTGEFLNINSLDYNRAGFAFAQDLDNGRLVDLDIVLNGGVTTQPIVVDGLVVAAGVPAGGLTATVNGSLSPTVGAISYDFINDRFLAADNATGSEFRNDSPLFDFSPFPEAVVNAPEESAILMEIRGLESDSAVGQTIGNILVGGTVLGKVDLSGSIEQFYAGWVMTGDATGMLESDIALSGVGGIDLFGNVVGVPDNFNVAGDMRKFVTIQSLGTDRLAVWNPANPNDNTRQVVSPNYLTGFDLEVAGRVGQIITLGSSVGSISIQDQNNITGIEQLSAAQTELEVRGGAFQAGALAIAPLFNDTFATAQYLHSDRFGINGGGNIIQVTGSLSQSDPPTQDGIDFFALPLLAGQEITIQVVTLFGTPVQVGVFDPDGRIVASDYSNLDAGEVANQPFRFKADKAGAYRLAVAFIGDTDFDESDPTDTGLSNYALTIIDPGAIALGGLVANENIFNNTPIPSIHVQRGDIGSIVAGRDGTGILVFEDDALNFGNDIEASSGNLREIDVQQSGHGDVGLNFGGGGTRFRAGTQPYVFASGDIGLLRSRGTPGTQDTGILRFNGVTAGGNVQLIQALTDLHMNLVAGGGLGVVRAGLFNSGDLSVSTINLNADLVGGDGTIDLIDVVFDLGGTVNGGPQITTGPGGNVRFMRAGGEIFQDSIFGGGTPTDTTFLPGTAANLRDDGGAQLRIAPVDPVPNPNFVEDLEALSPFDPRLDPDSPDFNPDLTDDPRLAFVAGQITSLTTYGIRGSGGVVVMSIEADHSLAITSNSAGLNQGAEISEILVSAEGASQFLDPVTGAVVAEPEDDMMTPLDESDDVRELVLTISGPNPVDVFSIEAAATIARNRTAGTLARTESTASVPTGPGANAPTANVVRGGSFAVINNTSGQSVGGGSIISMDVGAVGSLFASGMIGDTENHTGADVIGLTNARFLGLPFPFNQASQAIMATQIGSVRAHRGVGNVVVNNTVTDQDAFIGFVNANADGIDFNGEFEGINGPIYAMGMDTLGAPNDAESLGVIGTVLIGDGILPSGTGDEALAGIFADERIGRVTGINADIRGDIASSGSIGPINLTNGSIINADIMSVSDLADSRELSGGFMSLEDLNDADEIAQGDDFINLPDNEIGNITVSGSGGIIGLLVDGQDIGAIRVNRGFGLLNAAISRQGNDVEGDTIVDGFGIRDVTFSGGASQKNIIARGKGDILDPTEYDPDVRFSDLFDEQGIALTDLTGGFDPFFGYKPNRLIDLNSFLDSSPDPAGLHSGVIDNVFAQGSRDLKNVSAFRIVATNGFFPTSFDFANTIGRFTVLDLVDSVQITSGAIQAFNVGTNRTTPPPNVVDFNMTIAGPISRVDIKGSLLGNSSIFAAGPNGQLKNLSVGGDVEGLIRANGNAGNVKIGGDLLGDLIVDGSNAPRNALNSFILGGSLSNGSFQVEGNVGRIDVAESLGSNNEQLVVNGDVGTFRVGSSRSHDGAIVGLDGVIFGDVRSLDIVGALIGDLTIQGTVSNLSITADDVTRGGDIVTGDINVFGDAKTIRLKDGDIAAGAVVAAAQGIGRFDMQNGDIGVGAEVSTGFGDIKSFTVKNGDVFGNVLANNGNIDSLTIQGSDLGNGVDAALVSTRNIKRLRLDGSLRSGAMIDVEEEIGMVDIRGDVEAGSVIDAAEAATVKIGQSMLGAIMLGAALRGTKVSIGASLGNGIDPAALMIDGDASIDVKGGMGAGATVLIGNDLDQLKVGGVASGDVLVNGFGGRFDFGSLDFAVVTTAFDLDSFSAGSVDNSLVQVGAQAGADGIFATDIGLRDFGEGSARSTLKRFTAASVSSSIIASAGDIDNATVNAEVFRSSISSGFSVGSSAIAGLIADPSPLGSLAEQNAARSAADRNLLHGDIGTATFNGAGLMESSVTAGVDPGDDGIFGNVVPDPAFNDRVIFFNPTSVLPDGGGQSEIGRINGSADSDSFVLVDTGIGSNNLGGGAAVNTDVTYDLADLTTNNPLPAATGSATDGVVSLPGGGFVEISGDGTVTVHDDPATPDLIDAIVFTGTDSRTDITVVVDDPDTMSIGRVLGTDDAGLRSFESNADMTGDVLGGTATADVDIFIDGPVGGSNTFEIRDLGNEARGVIGGGVSNLKIRTQGSGVLRVAGTVKKTEIVNGDAGGLIIEQGSTPLPNVTLVGSDATGNIWVFDEANRQIARVDPVSGAILDGPFDSQTAGFGDLTDLSALSFNGMGSAIGLATINNQSPTHFIGTPANPTDPIALRTLAAGPLGQVVAVQSTDRDGDTVNDTDVLVAFDPDTGGAFPLGTLVDIFSNRFNGDFLALAYDDSGNLYGLVSDRDGNGAANTTADGVAIVQIDVANPQLVGTENFLTVSSPVSVGLPGLILTDPNTAGPTTDAFTAMAAQNDPADPDADPTIFAIQRDVLAGVDTLVTIDLTTGAITPLGAVQVDTDGDGVGDVDTAVNGIGFDEEGNLLAYNDNDVMAGLILIDPANIDVNGNVVASEVTTPGALDTSIDAFAVGRTGDNFATYAYDTDTLGGALFTNPSNETLNIGEADPRPIIQVNGDLGGVVPATGLAIRPTGNAFITVDNGDGTFNLQSIDRSLPGGGIAAVNDLGVIQQFTGVTVDNIQTMEASPLSGELFVIGSDAGSNSRELYSVSEVGALAASRGPLRDGNGDVTDPIIGLGIDPTDGSNYAIRIVGGTSVLVRLEIILALNVVSVQTVGEVQVGTESTSIVAGDFTSDGRYIAIEESATGRRMIEVNLTDPENSVQLTTPGSVNSNLSTIAVDQDDRILSLFTDDLGSPTQLWINAKANFVPTLGVVNTDAASPLAGQFRQLRAVADDATGAGIDGAVNAAVDFADTGDIFVVTLDGRLQQYDGGNGAFVADIGPLVEPGTGNAINIETITFDATGALIGKDADLNRLVTIDKTTGAVSGRTQAGAVTGDVTGLAFDPTVGAVRGVINAMGTVDDVFALFRGTTQDALRGIEADGFDDLRVTGGTNYTSRIAASRDGFKKIEIDGDYSGSITTPAGVDSFTQNDGTYSGLLQANGEIKKATLDDVTVLNGAVIRTDSVLGTLKQSGGSFAGSVLANSAGTIDLGGGGLPTATIDVTRDAGTVKLGSSYSGTASFGSISRSFDIRGTLGGTGIVTITGDNKRLSTDGLEGGSQVFIGGDGGQLDIAGVARGLIALDDGASRLTFNDTNNLSLIAGLDSGSLTVKGDAVASLFSFGTRIGDDGIYNTMDDRITGGSLKSATFQGDYADSATVAGVLPTLLAGPGKPTNTLLYVGNLASADIVEQDSAEAGGILSSRIESLTIRGFITSSDPLNGAESVAATANGFGKQNLGPFPDQLIQRSYGDPLGAPQIVEFQIVDASEFDIIFTEEVNSASFILAQDRNDDGDTTDVGDVQGTIELRDIDGALIDDVTLLYSTTINSEGDTLGVLRVIQPGGFQTPNVTVTISGGGPEIDPILDEEAVFDRSGGRNVVRNFNQDDDPFALEIPFGNPDGPAVDTRDPDDLAGTIFDGNRDGLEGHDGVTLLQFFDAADDFIASIEDEDPLPVMVDGGTLTLAATFETNTDIDIYRIDSAMAYQFLSVEYLGDPLVNMGIFIQDDQGTVLTDDDTFELITRWETNLVVPGDDGSYGDDEDLFQAHELRPIEDPTDPDGDGLREDNLNYFIGLVSLGNVGNYQLDITLASTDDLLDGITDGVADLGQPDEIIAYISNVQNTIDPVTGLPTDPAGSNNNFLGANEPKQLIYLNFNGGTSQVALPGEVFEPFDSAALNPALDNLEQELIFGSQALGVDGIIDVIVETLTTTPDTHPLGQLDVTVLSGDFTPFFTAGAEGIFLTTVDPRITGLDIESDFIEVLIGQNLSDPGLLGISGQIGYAANDKGSEVVVFVNNHAGLTLGTGTLAQELTDLAVAIGTTIAHEFGHAIGWNHTELFSQFDDPNNDTFLLDSFNGFDQSLMAAGGDPLEDLLALHFLSTAPLSTFEFGQIGTFIDPTASQAYIDQNTDILWWLS